MPSFMDRECIITAAPHPAFDVYPPSRRGDDPASEADHRDGPRQSAGRSAVVRHVPCRWRSSAAGVRAPNRSQAVDYDDLLLYWAEMMADDNLAAEIGDRFDHILVDEYQDTNRLQSKILLRLKPDGRGLMVVGDDAQSIYSFRAATVRNILDFPKQFRPAADIITLEQNYRSTQPILDACNKVIRSAKERYTKNLRSDRRSKQKPFLTVVA